MARRPTYKGSVQEITNLPIDACTVMGVLVLEATLLPTSTFSQEGVQECVAVLQALEEHMNVNCALQLLPHAQAFQVQVQDNLLPLPRIKAILHELGLSWSRRVPDLRVLFTLSANATHHDMNVHEFSSSLQGLQRR